MSISDNQKLDFLWKKLGYGATKTDINSVKTATNESIPSPLLLSGTGLWTDAYQIPTLIPSASSHIVEIYDDTGNGSTTVETVEDTTATPNRTWKTGSTNWIPPQFGSTYAIKVYIAPTGTADPQTSGTRIFAAGSGNNDEFFFDYQSGVLNFIGTNLPSGIDGNEIFIVGARYIGKTGNRFTALYADSADIGHAFIDSADIDMADIITAYIDSADILHAIIDSADITLAKITNATIDSAYIKYADIDHTDIDSADITLADIITANITTANINYADIDSADIDLAKIITANIDSADIGHAYIDSAEIGVLNITGQINGPQDFIIDPSAVGDNTGRVIIKGDLQVDGTETIVNSTTVSINDKNIVLADSAQDSSQADGAGITVFAANAKITYEAAQDRWVFNKDVDAPALYADSGIITYLTSTYGTIQYLTSDSATIGNITSTNIDTVNLDADSGTVTNLYSSTGVIVNLTSSNGVITVLASNYADIDSADIDQARILKATVDSAGIQYADIDSADIDVLRVKELTLHTLIAQFADIDSAEIDVLRAIQVSADSAGIKYADIDSADIELARVVGLNADSAHITGNLTVGGDLTVAGNATIKSQDGGNIYLGDSNEDNIIFSADVNSHIIPNITETYNLGSDTKRWKDIYLSGNSIYLGTVVLKDSEGNLSIQTPSGQPGDVYAKGLYSQTLDVDSATINRFTADSAVIQYLRVGQNLTVDGDGLTTNRIIAEFADIDSAEIDKLRTDSATINTLSSTNVYATNLNVDSARFREFSVYGDSASHIRFLEGDSAKFVNLHVSGELTGNVGVTGLIPYSIANADSLGELVSDSDLMFGPNAFSLYRGIFEVADNGDVTATNITANSLKLSQVSRGEIFYSGSLDSVASEKDFTFKSYSSIFGNINGLGVGLEEIYDSGYFKFNVDKNTGQIAAEGGTLGYYPNRPTGKFFPIYPSPKPLEFYGIDVQDGGSTPEFTTTFTSQHNVFKSDITKAAGIALDSSTTQAQMLQVVDLNDSNLFSVRKDGSIVVNAGIHFDGPLLQNGLPYTGPGVFSRRTFGNIGFVPDASDTQSLGGGLVYGGNVGVNTLTPKHQLEVNDGDFYISGSLANTNYPEVTASVDGGFSYGAGSKFLFQPSNATLRAGYWDNGTFTTPGFGQYSIALGKNTRAGASATVGLSAVALGDSAFAADDYSIAIGKNQRTGAGNLRTTAIGTDNIITNSSGTTNKKLTVIGHDNTLGSAGTINASIYGVGNTVADNADNSIVLGYLNAADKIGSIILGLENDADGANAILIGRTNSAAVTSTGGVAIGNDNSITGTLGMAFGSSNTVSGQTGIAFGSNVTVSGDFSVGYSLSGANHSVTQDNTFAIQGGTVAIGDSNSHGKTLYVNGDTEIIGDIVYSGELLKSVVGGGFISANIFVDDGVDVVYNPTVPKKMGVAHADPYAQFDISGSFQIRNDNLTAWNKNDLNLDPIMDSTQVSNNQFFFHPQSGVLRAGSQQFLLNEMLGIQSVGLGTDTRAGDYSVSLGRDVITTENSFAIGYNVNARDEGMSLGIGLINNGVASYVIGKGNRNYSPNNYVIGLTNLEGDSNTVGKNFIIGETNNFSGEQSYILGKNNQALNTTDNTYVVGRNNIYEGTDAYILGRSHSTVDGVDLYSVGRSNNLPGTDVYNLGYSNNLNGTNIISVGILNTTDAASSHIYTFGRSNSLNGTNQYAIGANKTLTANANNTLVIDPNNTSATVDSENRIIIGATENTNVGIGKTSAFYKLDVEGDINLNGNLFINNVPAGVFSFDNTAGIYNEGAYISPRGLETNGNLRARGDIHGHGRFAINVDSSDNPDLYDMILDSTGLELNTNMTLTGDSHTITGDLKVVADSAFITGNLTVGGDISVGNILQTTSNASTGDSASINGKLTINSSNVILSPTSGVGHLLLDSAGLTVKNGDIRQVGDSGGAFFRDLYVNGLSLDSYIGASVSGRLDAALFAANPPSIEDFSQSTPPIIRTSVYHRLEDSFFVIFDGITENGGSPSSINNQKYFVGFIDSFNFNIFNDSDRTNPFNGSSLDFDSGSGKILNYGALPVKPIPVDTSIITNITSTNPVTVVQSVAHGHSNKAAITFTVTDPNSMVELDGNTYYASIIDPILFDQPGENAIQQFALYEDEALTTKLNGTGFTTFSGSVSYSAVPFVEPVVEEETTDLNAIIQGIVDTAVEQALIDAGVGETDEEGNLLSSLWNNTADNNGIYYFDAAGKNVGINTTTPSPAYKLDVNGAVRASDYYIIQNSVTKTIGEYLKGEAGAAATDLIDAAYIRTHVDADYINTLVIHPDPIEITDEQLEAVIDSDYLKTIISPNYILSHANDSSEWQRDSDTLFFGTTPSVYNVKVGIGKRFPDTKFHVAGTGTFDSDLTVKRGLTVSGFETATDETFTYQFSSDKLIVLEHNTNSWNSSTVASGIANGSVQSGDTDSSYNLINNSSTVNVKYLDIYEYNFNGDSSVLNIGDSLGIPGTDIVVLSTSSPFSIKVRHDAVAATSDIRYKVRNLANATDNETIDGTLVLRDSDLFNQILDFNITHSNINLFDSNNTFIKQLTNTDVTRNNSGQITLNDSTYLTLGDKIQIDDRSPQTVSSFTLEGPIAQTEGAVSFSGGVVSIADSATIAKDLVVTGGFTAGGGSLTSDGDLTVTSGFTAGGGSLTSDGVLTTTDSATIGGNINISGTLTTTDSATINGNISATGALHVVEQSRFDNGLIIRDSDVILENNASLVLKDSAETLYFGPLTIANYDSPNGSIITDYKIGRSFDSNVERVVDSDYIGTRLQSPWNRIGSEPNKKIYYDEGGPVIIGPVNSLQPGDSESKLVLQGGNVLFLDDSSDVDIAGITPSTVPNHGEGPRLMWLPKRGAFRAGYVDGSVATWGDSEVGIHSVGIGKNARSSHFGVAIGYETKAGSAVLSDNSIQNSNSQHTSVAIGNTVQTAAASSVGLGKDITIPNKNNNSNVSDIVAIGSDISTSNTGQVAIGKSATTSGATGGGANRVAIGSNVTAGGNVGGTSVSIGYNQSASNGGVSIGSEANASKSGVAIGSDITTNGNGNGVGIGKDITAGQSGLAIGSSSSSGLSGVSIGKSTSTGQSGVSIGKSTSTGQSGTSIGNSAASGRSGVSIGKSTSTGQNGVAIGSGVTAGQSALVIGSSMSSSIGRSSTVIGRSNTSGVSQTVIGSGNIGTGGNGGGTLIGVANQASNGGVTFGINNYANRGVAIGSGNYTSSRGGGAVLIGSSNSTSEGGTAIGKSNRDNRGGVTFGVSNSNNGSSTYGGSTIFGSSNNVNHGSTIYGISNRSSIRSTLFGKSNVSNESSIIYGLSNNSNNSVRIYGSDNTSMSSVKIFGDFNNNTTNAVSTGRDAFIYGSRSLVSGSGYTYGSRNQVTNYGMAFGHTNTISNTGYSYGQGNSINYGGFAYGKDNTIDGYSLGGTPYAFGTNNLAKQNSILFGRDNIGEGTSIALGNDLKVKGTNSLALGSNAAVNATNSMVIGLGSTPISQGDSLIDNNTLAILNGFVSIGTNIPDPNYRMTLNGGMRLDGNQVITTRLDVGEIGTETGEIYRNGKRLYNYILQDVVNPSYILQVADSDYVATVIDRQYLVENILPSFNFGGTNNGLVYTGGLDVGIHNNNPQFDLDVGGDINYSGTLYLNGTKLIPSYDSLGDVYIIHQEVQYYIDADSAEAYFDSAYVALRQDRMGFELGDSVRSVVDDFYINSKVDFSFLPDSNFILAEIEDYGDANIAFKLEADGNARFNNTTSIGQILGGFVGINIPSGTALQGPGLNVSGTGGFTPGGIFLDDGNLNITNGRIFVDGVQLDPVSPFIDDGTFVAYAPTGGAPTLNVGIGKSSPQYSLDVAGDINIDADDHYRVNGIQLIGNIGDTHLIDSAYVQARQLFIDSTAVKEFIDSNYIKGFIDSDYIQARVDSNYIKGFIDSDYIKGFADSDYIKGFVDSSYIKGFADSDYIKGFIDSSYIKFYADSNYVKTFIDSSYIKLHADSDYVKTFIDSSYIKLHADSDYVKTFINESYIRSHADSAWVTSIADEDYVKGIADSNYVKTFINESYIRSHADSAWVTSIADSDYIKNITDSDYIKGITNQPYVRSFIDSAYITTKTGIGRYPQNFGSNSIIYSNEYNVLGLAPSAGTYPGMFINVAGATNRPYVSQNGTWNTLARGQDVRVTDSVEFAELTITGDLTVLGTRTILNTQTLGIDDPMIHLGKNNETSDAVDIGFIGHYSPDGGATKEHTGFFRDATNGEYYLFNGLDDAALDDSDPTATVNRTASGFTLATLNVGAILGSYAGFDSDFNAKSTTDLSEGSNLYYTTTRADSAFDDRLLTKTTDNLTEGTNLYYTQGRFDAAFTAKSTTDLSEGTNLYYTDDRVTSHVDSAYVQLRSPQFDYLTVIDSAYVQARQEPGTDSAAVIALINANATLDSAATVSLIDSAYVNARVSTVDSAQVLAIVDSDYILRIAGSGGGGTGGATILRTYNYVATSGQTTFQDSDTSGNILEYTVGSQIVTANGITLTSGTDYTATSGSSIVFAVARDSDDEISVITTISSGDAGATGSTATSGFNVTSGSTTSFDQTLHNNNFKSIEYVIHMDDSDNNQSQISKVLLTYNKSNVFTTEYGLVNSYSSDSDMGEITAVATASMIQLQLTKSTGTGIVAVKTTKTIIS